MNDIYFAIYNAENDRIEVYTKDKLKVVFDCARLNDNVFLEDTLDIAYSINLQEKNHLIISTSLYNLMDCKGIVEAMNVFN